mmetsp:Transcript_33930/g.95459  ORF Transcript_33930/g.95459 Transcript_33930/m.95459 type:complete len:952 (+) Transcript_33930:178-3033(+)
MATLLVLYESASGYALFQKKEYDEVAQMDDAVQQSLLDLSKFGKAVKLKAFTPFKSAEDALANINAVSEGVAHETLVNFLEMNFPKSKKAGKYLLGVSEEKLGGSIQEQCDGVKCVKNQTVTELQRVIRLHFDKVLSAFKEGDLEKAQLGLGHSYSRCKVKFNVNRVDNMIIQSIALLDQLNKDINTFAMRVREWYSWHFPELARLVKDNIMFARLAATIRRKEDANESLRDRLEEVTLDSSLTEKILAAIKSSMGQDISPVDLLNICTFSERVISLDKYRTELEGYLHEKMGNVAPNLSALVGDTVGARLISHAGSLTSLAKYPASTVQILGAEKALFRALKTRGNTPKYGLIYHSTFIGRASAANKGRISRYLANKCSLASRIDCFSNESTDKFGLKLREQVEDRLRFYDTGEAPAKNIDVMHGVVAALEEERGAAGSDEEAELPASGKKRSRRASDDDDMVEAPKKKKKKKKDKRKDVHDVYTIGDELGRGAFSIVKLATDKADGSKWAVKIIDKKSVGQDMDRLETEIEILKKVQHPNIICLKDIYDTSNYFYIVTELVTGGELFDKIVEMGNYSEKDAAVLVQKMLSAIGYLHNLNIVHRDLKPENFLFAGEEEESDLKVTDFGLSTFYKPGMRFTDVVGSAYYIAPEVLQRGYGPECDVWSVGVIMYIVLSGRPPFFGRTESEVFNRIMKAGQRLEDNFKRDPWPRISDPAKALIRKMLSPDPRARITAAQALADPWVRIDGVAPDIPLDVSVVSAMKEFTGYNRMKQLALRHVASVYHEEEIRDLREQFALMDKDGDGALTLDEMVQALRKMELGEGREPLEEAEIRSIVDSLDYNNDGTIDYLEFTTAALHIGQKQRGDREGWGNKVKLAFDKIDKDGNGLIETHELEQELLHMGETAESIKELIEMYDENGDGMINFDEFSNILRQRAKSRMRSRPSSAKRK